MVRSDMLPQPDRGLGLDRPQTEAFHRRVQEEDSRSPQRRKAQARGHGRVRPRQEHVERRVKSINETGSPRAADNRTPE